MKKILLLSAAVLSILAAVSCAKEEQETENRVVKSKARTTLTATLQSSKTALGDMVAGAWPNFWKTDDQISVNGVISDPLDANYDGQTDASFSFEGLLTPNYYAAYPASAVSGYDQGNATITVPAVQNFANGTYDPAAFIMGGVSGSDALVLSPKVSVIHLSFTGTASICRIKLTGASEAALSGTFSTNFTDFTPVNVSNVVELKAADAVQLPADFFIAVPVGLVGALNVTAYDSDGGKMSRNATVKSALAAGQVYSPAALAYTPSYAIEATAEGITSSTAIICWDNCGDSGHCPAYTVSVYSDAGCNDLVASYAVPAGDACWGNEAPRFCISGLAANTTYYVKVVNVTKDVESNVLPVTTSPFEIVEVTNTPAEEGDVILAEDFGELRWDSELINGGVGYFPTSQDQFSNSVVDQFLPIDTNSEKTLGSQTSALLLSRLAHWAQGAKNNLYIHPGYIKLVGNKNVTHLVTPALNNIPEGMLATLEVEITACPYFSESSASYATFDAIVAVQPAGNFNELPDETKTNTLDLTSNFQPITLDAETAWKTYKVTLTGVGKGARLAFGAHKDVTQNSARMNISDMKVTIKALNEPGDLVASVKSVSSSTASFTWSHLGSSAAEDVAKPYTIALYSDENCENLVVSFDIPADDACWNGKTPCFVFGGLNPDTEYWFVATDTDASVSSDPVSATTEAFTVVDATTVTEAAVGDVILGEDFSEIAWGSDDFAVAAGFVPSTHAVTVPSGNNPEGSFVNYSSTGDRIFGAGWDLGESRLSKKWGFLGNSATYYQNGFLRVATKSGRTHVVTPALSGIPAGMRATIEVTVTACKYEANSNDVAVFVMKGLTMNEETNPSSPNFRKYADVSLSNGYGLDITSVKNWETKSVTITGVDAGCQLVIGSLENISEKNRFYLSDVTVTITDLKEPGLEASCKSVSSSSAVFTWTYGDDASADIAKPYTFALYRDAACTDLVVSYESTENADRWNNKSPCFVFGGLTPATTYWFQVKDTENGKLSEPVSATTEAFTVVESADVTNPQAGDVILAEDFSEISHGPDELAVAAGFVLDDHTLITVPSGENPDGTFCNYENTGNRVFGSGWDITGSRMANGWGFFGNSACFTRSGYLRVASSDGRTHIVTPALSCIPAGKIATIEVTVTACKYESNTNDVAVFAEKGLTMNPEASPSSSNFRKYTGASLSVGHALGITSVKEWETKSVTIDKVDNSCQLIIGSLEDISGKNRFYFNDIIVEVVSIEDIPLKSISNDETFLEFVTEVAGGNKSLDAIVTADLNLAPATISAFESIEDYTGTFDGGNHSITGLTKPLFATLEGTVKDLTLNSTISSDDADDPIWGILAKQLSAGSVSGCTAQGSITYSATSPSAQAYIGGVVGKYSGGTLTGCYNEASITYSATGSNKIYIGGVVSNNEKSTLSDCHSTAGTISVTGYSTAGPVYVGGVVGYDTKTISSCTNAMTVDFGGSFTATSTNYWCNGGIAGKVTGGSITNCLNTGEVIYSQKMGGSSKGYTFVGGIVGHIKGSISDSSNGGTVSFTGKTDSQNPYIGGIVGSTDSNGGSITGKYSSASATNYGEVIVNSSQSKKYVYVGGVAGRLHTDYTMTTTNDGPITITKLTCTQAYVGGLAGYSSSTGSVINSGSANLSGGTITVTSLTGNGASSYSAFIGGVVGKTLGAVNANNAGNLAINGLYSKLNACVGGVVGFNSAAVSGNNDGNVVVSDGTTFVKSAYIGGILGRGENPVSSSTNNGNVSNAAPMNDTGGYMQLGGIVGYNNKSCTISDCHNNGVITNTADVEGYLYVGGITSESDAAISNCTNTGDVSNSGDSGNGHPICVGGITGVASADVESSSNGTDTEPGGTISNTGNSAEDICIGGVIGWNNNKKVTTCFNKGNVSNEGNGGNIAAGGVVGWSSATSSYVEPNTNSGTITNTGTASTAAYTGEVIGYQAE